jgi:hypothetical protein
MPFRKLPISDSDMTVAMQKLINAYDLRVTNQPDPLKRVQAFSAETYDLLTGLLSVFEKEIRERTSALVEKTSANRPKVIAKNKLKKVVDHFIMVLNLAIDREVYTPHIRALYGLDMNQKNRPLIYSHNDITMFALKIIGGETIRIAQGGLPMQNPSLADVQAAYDEYISLWKTDSSRKSNFYLQREDVKHLRKQVRAAIREAWDEIEFFFRKNALPSLRSKARNWGVEYGIRKGKEKPGDREEMGGL